MKDWFKGRGGAGSQDLSVDDLIVLERYDEAASLLELKIKANSRDLHSRTKLAEVYAQLRRAQKAVEQYTIVAEAYAQDGFHDKGIALLSRAARLAPQEMSIQQRIEKLRRGKDSGRVRTMAVGALREADQQGGRAATAAVELEQIWDKISGSQLVQALPPEQIKRLFAVVEIKRVQADEILAKRGEQRPEILIIASAEVEAAVEGKDGRLMTLRSFSSGDVIGESTLLEHQSWPATFKVTQPGSVLRIVRESLERAMMGNTDPRQLLDALREQHNDREVVSTLQQVRGS